MAEAQPAASTVAGKPANRGRGRPKDEETARMYKYCYDRYTDGAKRLLILAEVKTKFPASAPKEDRHITTYAKRYGKQNNLPFTPRS
jgi:hypothetical protein